MKKRVFCLILAAVLALGMCTPALASDGDLFDRAWDMALLMKDAAGVSIYAELVLEWTDPACQALGLEAGVSLEASTANFSDGYMCTVCEYEFGVPNQEWDDQGMLVVPGGGVYFVRDYSGPDSAEEEIYEHYGDVDSAPICDVSRAYLYFASLGDNEMGAQVTVIEPHGENAVYTASGDGLRLLLETCFPQVVLGCADALDWQNISASVRVKVDPYGDNTYVVLESSQLGEALLRQVPGLEAAQNVQLDLEIDIEAIPVGMESEFEDVYDELHPDPAGFDDIYTQMDGPARQVQPLVEYIRSAYGNVVGETDGGTSSSLEEMKDAIRAELAGQTGGGTGVALSGEEAKDAIRAELAGQTGGQVDKLAALAAELMSSGAFTADMTVFALDQLAAPTYGFDAGKVTNCHYYYNNSSNEEMLLAEAVDGAAAEQIEQCCQQRVELQKSSLANYNPDAIPRLDSAVLVRSGNYVVFVVSDDNAAARTIVENGLR